MQKERLNNYNINRKTTQLLSSHTAEETFTRERFQAAVENEYNSPDDILQPYTVELP